MKTVTRPAAPPSDEYHAPQGTIALLFVYLVLIIAGWIGVYLTMLSRGAVQ